MGEDKHYRLITRSDFDGLVCAVLFKKMDMIDEVKFVHPKDMQDGLIEVEDKDISTNLPYVEGIHLAFDHHESEKRRVGERDNYIIIPEAPSTARVVYDYYEGKKSFPDLPEELMESVDKGDSGDFTREEVLNPQGWVLLNFIMDPRTGLGRFRNFRISNYQLMMDLIDYCTERDIDEILALPDVKQRVDLYNQHKELFINQVRENSEIYGNVLVLDFREEETIYAGNRFLKYALYPECDISIQVMWGFKRQNTVLTVGKSIFNRSNPVNIGDIMYSYGGGGHGNAGTCQVDNNKADAILKEIIAKIRTR